MTQVPFQAHDSQVGMEFNPTYQTDFVPAVEQSNKEVLADLQKRNADLFTYENAAARGKDNLLKNLAPYSRTIRTALEPAIQRHEARKNLEAIKTVEDLAAKNPSLYQAEFTADRIERAEEVGHQRIVDKAKNDNEIDVYLANELLNIHPRQQKRIKRQLLIEQADRVVNGGYTQGAAFKFTIPLDSGGTEKRSLNDPRNTINERNIIQSHIKNSFLNPYSGDDWDPIEVHQYLGKQIDKLSDQDNLKHTDQKDKEYQLSLQNIRINEVSSALRYVDVDGAEAPALGLQTLLTDTYMPMYTWAGKQQGQLARQKMASDLQTLATTRKFQDISLLRDGLMNQEINWKGDGAKVSSFFDKFEKTGEFDFLRGVIEKNDLENITIARQERANRSNEFELSFYDIADQRLKEKGLEGQLSNGELRDIMQQALVINPTNEIPKGVKDYITKNDRVDSADRLILEGIFEDKGIVTGADTLNMSPATKKWATDKFGPAYQPDEGGTIEEQAAPYISDLEGEIDSIVNTTFNNLTGDLKDSNDIVVAKRLAKRDVQQRFMRNLFDPSLGIKTMDQAYAITKKQIQDELEKGFQNTKGNPGPYTSLPFKTNQNEALRLNQITQFAKTNPDYYKQQLLPGVNKATDVHGLTSDIAILQRIQKGERLSIPKSFEQYAAMLDTKKDIDGYDVANEQLKLYEVKQGLKPKGLPNRPIIKQYTDGLTDMEIKKLLKVRPSYSRTSRAIILQDDGNFNSPDLVVEGALEAK